MDNLYSLLEQAENNVLKSEEYVIDTKYNQVAYSDSDIIYIDNKSISSMSKQIAIVGEANSQYIQFELKRYYDGIDLVEKQFMIHFERPDGNGDNTLPVNFMYSDQNIRFGWVIPKSACGMNGKLKVMPFAYSGMATGNQYIIKTLYAELDIKNGLAIDGGIVQPSSSWYEDFIGMMEGYIGRVSAYSEEVNEKYEIVLEKAEEATVASQNAQDASESAKTKATEAGQRAGEASLSEANANTYAKKSQSYAVGGTGTRAGEDTDNAKYYCEVAKGISEFCGLSVINGKVYQTFEES